MVGQPSDILVASFNHKCNTVVKPQLPIHHQMRRAFIGHTMYRQTNFKRTKYNAVKTNYNGYNYPSKLEARQAAELDLRLAAGDILGWERQYKVDFDCLMTDGTPTNLGSHKVDFRISELDGSFTLLETKGVVTNDYMLRRRMLEKLWLPMHPDHTYLVVK